MSETKLSSVRASYLVGGVIAIIGFLLFATKAIFVKMAYQYDIDAVSLLMLRMSMALPFFAVTGWLSYRKRPEQLLMAYNHKWALIILGLLGYYIASYLDFKGLTYIDASLERIILYIYPTIVIIISKYWYNTIITPIQILSIALTYVGIIIAYSGNLAVNPSHDVFIGAMLVLGCAFSYALFIAGSQKYSTLIGTQMYNSLVMTVACIAVILHNLLFNYKSYLDFDPQVYILSFLIATLSTVLPSYLIVEGIRRIGASTSSIFGAVGPIATMVMASYLLSEEITVLQWIGSIIVIGGVLMVLLNKQSISN
jgi:drug/metabolite transporter (DMT)-like permease